VDADEDSGKIIDKLILNADPPYDIALVSDKRNALYQVRTSTFDLYILDYGATRDIDLCAKIRDHHPETPILFITGDIRVGDRQLAMEKGATDLLVKPEELGRIGDTVDRLLCGSIKTRESLGQVD
jgi:DNA-binding response OmpR family regulator